MPNLTVVRLGHPALRARSKVVSAKEAQSEEFQIFLDDLIRICDDNNGVGIAAPQVGVNKRVIIVHVDPKNPRYKDKKPFPVTIIINPKIEKLDTAIEEDWEGDLSCNLRALVPRSIGCVVSGLDRNAKPVRFTLDYPFHARVFQHEIDHLNGIFLLDKVVQKDSICELREWKKYWKETKPKTRLKPRQ